MCDYCSNFFDNDFAGQFITTKTASATRIIHRIEGDDEVVVDTRKSTGFPHVVVEGEPSTPGLSDKALDVIVKLMDKNEKIANFEEIKINTEILLGVF